MREIRGIYNKFKERSSRWIKRIWCKAKEKRMFGRFDGEEVEYNKILKYQ